jgi:phytoene desaturase
VSRVVVVGGGMGGLAAAARLAAGGHRVTLCEQQPTVGGKLGVEILDTPAGPFRFDTGPHLLTLPHVLATLFAETGEPLASVLDLEPIEPLTDYRFPDGTRLVASTDQRVFRQRLDDTFGGGAGSEWARFWRRAEAVWQATHGPFLESPVATGTLLKQAVRIRDLRTIAPWRTLRGLGRTYLTDPRLRQVLERYATYTGSDPRHAPAALAAVPYAEFAYGGWYVRGGLRRIADALAARCAELGVTIRTCAQVTRIELAAGRAAGVRLADGERLAADLVVANADAEQVYTDLIRSDRTVATLRALRRAIPSLSGFVLLLALRGRTPGLAQHTVLFPDDYDAEFDAVFGDPGRPVADPTLFVSAPDDPALAPAGHEAWFVLVNAARQGVGRGTVDWRTPGLADWYADQLLDRLGARGLDVRDRLLARAVRTPAELETGTGSVGGAIYGTSSNGPRAAFLRPANASPVPGLFLVGGSSHPGGGLPLVALSAQIVAGLIGPA